MNDAPLEQLAAADYDCKHILVHLIGEDGNAMSIIGRCIRAMARERVPKPVREAFRKEAMSGDYNNVLVTVMSWFTVADSCRCCE